MISACIRGFFCSSRRRHTRCSRDWSSDVCSSDLGVGERVLADERIGKVSVVGAGMRSHPGVAARVFETLGEHEINIEMRSEERRVGKECTTRRLTYPQ